jgi:putative methionine-R-sulfoxide reductase with GAF domain
MTNAPPPPTSAAQSARTILTRLHEVMASRTNAQSKLNKVVHIIGESLNSEVCSIYLLRDGTLELYATRGLKQEAVHVTRLALGEGLVGTSTKRRRILILAIVRKPAKNCSTALRASPSSAANAPLVCCAFSTQNRAVMTSWKSRRCKPLRWYCLN